MKKQTKQIGGIAIAILAGAWALVRAYNAGSVRGYTEGKVKGIDTGFKGGWDMGWNAAVSSMFDAGAFTE